MDLGQPVVVVDTQHAWGYHFPEDFGKIGEDSQFRQLIYFHDICNALSVALSPLIGLVRLVASIFFLMELGKTKQADAKMDLEAAKRFMWMQMGRGALELLFLGPILGTVVDGTMTLWHREMLCFSKA